MLARISSAVVVQISDFQMRLMRGDKPLNRGFQLGDAAVEARQGPFSDSERRQDDREHRQEGTRVREPRDPQQPPALDVEEPPADRSANRALRCARADSDDVAGQPALGAPRINGELLKLGIDVCQATVAKYMVCPRRPPTETWHTLLPNHIGQVMAADFFVVATATCRLLFVPVILAHERRRVVHVAVTEHPTAAWTAQQLRGLSQGPRAAISPAGSRSRVPRLGEHGDSDGYPGSAHGAALTLADWIQLAVSVTPDHPSEPHTPIHHSCFFVPLAPFGSCFQLLTSGVGYSDQSRWQDE